MVVHGGHTAKKHQRMEQPLDFATDDGDLLGGAYGGAPSTPTVYIEGFLWKKGILHKAFKRRHFRLMGHQLIYSLDISAPARGHIDLRGSVCKTRSQLGPCQPCTPWLVIAMLDGSFLWRTGESFRDDWDGVEPEVRCLHTRSVTSFPA